MKPRIRNINRKKLTESDFSKGQQFDDTLQGLKKAKTINWAAPKLWIGIAATALVATVITLFSSPEKKPSDLASIPEKSSEFIKPAFNNIDLKDTSLTVDAEKGGIIQLQKGSYIDVPPNAFVDERGNPIKGTVDLKYREFRDPADFFVSGIPMEYDSGGVKYTFESAGMFELKGYQNDKKVYIKKGNPLTVNFASDYKDDRYNIYKLDTAKKGWEYIAKDDISKKPKETVAESNYNTETFDEYNKSSIVYVPKSQDMPAKPQKAVEGKRHLKIAVEESEFPEIAVYKDVTFEIDPKDYDLKPSFGSIVWDDVKMQKNERSGFYQVTFFKEKDSVTFPAKPVFEGVAYDKAVKMYEDKLKEYNAKLDSRKTKELNEQAQIEAANKKAVQDWDKYQARIAEENRKRAEEQQKMWANMAVRQRVQGIIYRTFQVENFGFWNSDCPANMPQGQIVQAEFQDEKGERIIFDMVYLVDKNRNALYNVYSGQATTQFSYNPNSQTMLWAITAAGKLALFTVEDFADLKPVNNKTTIIKLNTVAKSFANEKEVKSYLDI
jgi:hypothetical protein